MNEETRQRVLIVEDEPKLAELMGDYLRQSAFAVETVGNGREVIPRLRKQGIDLVLLDVMLPGCDGMELLRELRTFSAVPVIMVTARVEELDRLLGLELGADDYICKPFSPREVVARVKAVLRRTLARDAGTADAGIEIDEAGLSACAGGQLLDLTRAEFRLLATLAAQPGRVFSRDQLLDAIHDDFRAVGDRAIDSHIKNLRRKLGAHCEGDPIQSVYGVGYKLECDA